MGVPSGAVVITTSRMSSSFSVSMTSGLRHVGRVERVLPTAEEPHGPDVVRLGAEREDVAPDVRVRASDRVLDLLHRHAVLLQESGVEEHLILLDGPPVAGHVDDARDLLEERVQHPILDGLELIRRVARAFEDVADDLARSGSRERGRA